MAIGVSAFVAFASKIGAAFAAGAGLVAAIGVRLAIQTIHHKRRPAPKLPDDLDDAKYFIQNRKDRTLKERHAIADEREKILRARRTIGSLSMTTVLTAFNPFYLPIYALHKTIAFVAKPIHGFFSRSMEFQADRGAIALGADPLAMITSLRKLDIVYTRSLKQAFNGELPKKSLLSQAWKKATASHPPVAQRVARLKKIAAKQGVDEAKIEEAAHGALEVDQSHAIPHAILEKMISKVI